MNMILQQTPTRRMLASLLVIAVIVAYCLMPVPAHAANTNLKISIGNKTSFSTKSTEEVLEIPFVLTKNSDASSSVFSIYLQEYKNGLWVKSDYAYSVSVYSSAAESSGTLVTKDGASGYIPGGTHTFRLWNDESASLKVTSPVFTVTVTKTTPVLNVSDITVRPAYNDPGKGYISASYSVTGYADDRDEENWELQKKSGSGWKPVSCSIYRYIKKIDTTLTAIGTKATYRLYYKGDAYSNATSKEFVMFGTKLTVKIAPKKSYKSGKKTTLTVKLSKKTSGTITGYFKGKAIGSFSFTNKKSVKAYILMYGADKGKFYVKFTPANKDHTNAKSKAYTIKIKR